VFNRSITLCAP